MLKGGELLWYMIRRQTKGQTLQRPQREEQKPTARPTDLNRHRLTFVPQLGETACGDPVPDCQPLLAFQ